jgi:RND family efflux transporter MFP subunit
MKRTIIVAIICIIAGIFAGRWLFDIQKDIQKNLPETGGKRKILYYRDPMNPQMTSNVPKKAPDGMDYVPVYEEEAASSATGERKIAYYKDPMHPWYTSDKPGKAPDCGMDLVPVYEDDKDVKGVKINPNTVQNMGVKVEKVIRKKLEKTIRTSAIIEYDETKIYNVNTKFMGWIDKLFVDYTGENVNKGDPLLTIYSPELVSTQEEYLQALRFREKMKNSSLYEARQKSEGLVNNALKRLKYWDISPKEISSLNSGGEPKRFVVIYSPAKGIVLEKMAVSGQQVMPGMMLYKIADLSNVWITADIYQFDLEWIKTGQEADIELSYLPGKSIRGTTTYIYPYLNDETRTAKIRIEAQNTPDFLLKPGMFATVKIACPLKEEAVAVDEQAIIRSGERNIAVIALGGGYFEPREVKTGISADGYVQVLEGLNEGENIVTSAQFLIDSESNLKAAISLMGSGESPSLPQKNDLDDVLKDLKMDDMPGK